mgnify:CR=1 FL=1
MAQEASSVMSLGKRIKSIIIISVLSVFVLCGYYLLTYFLGSKNVDTTYSYTDEEIKIIRDTEKIDIQP